MSTVDFVTLFRIDSEFAVNIFVTAWYCCCSLRQQAQEMYKRKAVESAQTAADLKLHLDKYHAQLKEVQVAVSEKTSTLQQQSFKFKRIQVSARLSLSYTCLY